MSETIIEELISGPQLKELPKLHLDQTEGPLAQQVRKLLGKKLRVTMEDGRVVEGQFRVFDKLKNIILADATEIWNVQKIEEPAMWEIEEEPTGETQKIEWEKKKKVFARRYEDLKNGIERRPAGAVLLLGQNIVKVEIDDQSVSDVPPSQVTRAQMGDELTPLNEVTADSVSETSDAN